MFRSLRGRLITLVALLVVAGAAAGALMFALFQQSATALTQGGLNRLVGERR
jgi:hypothetical protein